MVESGYTIWLVLLILILLLLYFLSLEGENGYENIKAHPKAVTVAIFVLATLLFISLAALAHTEQARKQGSTDVNNLVKEIKANTEEFRKDLKEIIQTVMSNKNSQDLAVVTGQLAYMQNFTDRTFTMLQELQKNCERDNKGVREQLDNYRSQKETCEINRLKAESENKVCQDRLADIQNSENKS